MIDGEPYGDLTVDKLDAILDGIRVGISRGAHGDAAHR